jgi:short-subunit dehydrogenase
VVLAARRTDRLDELVQVITAQTGEALAIETDVGQLDSINQMVEQTLQQYGQIDVLFNNAGFGRTKWLEELDPEKDIAGQVQINLLGLIQTTRAVLPHMLERKAGHIINMASLGAFVGTPTYTVYAATKFGVRGFTEALRREVGIWGIKVSILYPGGVATEFAEHMGAERKTGITTPKALLLYPEDVGKVVVQLVKKGRSRSIVLPGVSKLGLWVNALLPWLNDWIIERTFTRPERDL